MIDLSTQQGPTHLVAVAMCIVSQEKESHFFAEAVEGYKEYKFEGPYPLEGYMAVYQGYVVLRSDNTCQRVWVEVERHLADNGTVLKHGYLACVQKPGS